MTPKHFATVTAAITAFCVSVLAVQAQQGADPRVADLVHSGKIKVALGLGRPALAMKDPKSGEVRGAALDLGRALAAKIGVKFEQVLYPGPSAVLKGIQNNDWDVTFLVVNPGLSALADSSLPYMQSDFTYLVPAGSNLHSVSEMDQTGIRVAVPNRHGSDLRLTKTLKHAELVRVTTTAAALDLIREGKVDAYASTRPALMALRRRAPGSQVLKDGFADISWAAIVPKGNAGRIAYLNDFLKAAKASGLVQQTIDGNGLKGIKVTP